MPLFFSQGLCLLKNLTILLEYPSSIKPIPQPIQKHMVNTKTLCELPRFLNSLSLKFDRRGWSCSGRLT